MRLQFDSVIKFFAALFLLIGGAKAFFSFYTGFDYLYYHLPIALSKFHGTTLEFSGLVPELVKGLPPLPHFVMGLLALVSIPATGALNFLGFIFFVMGLKALDFKLPWHWVVLGLGTIPLFGLHLTSGYIDLWSNLWVALGFLGIYKIETNEFKFQYFAVTAFALIAAMFSKLQMWPVVAIAILVFLIVLFQKNIFKASKVKIWFCLLIFGTCFWPLRNTIMFGNPTYPYAPPVIGSVLGIKFNSPVADYEKIANEQVPEVFAKLPRTLVFFISAFELNRFVDLNWSPWRVDAWASGEVNNPHFRMGGWSLLTMLFILIGLFRKRKVLNLKSTSVVGFVLSVLFVSILPQSHEMRYFLYIPIVLLMVWLIALQKQEDQLIYKWLRGIGFVWLLTNISTGFFALKFASIESKVPEAAKKYIEYKEAGGEDRCIDAAADLMIYFTGKEFNQFKVVGCPKTQESK